jgi:hypothetical protein
MVSSLLASSSASHHQNHCRHRRRGRSASLLFLVTMLVSTASNIVCSRSQVSVSSFSPSPTGSSSGNARRGRTKSAFGGGGSTSSSTKKKSTASKVSNEQETQSKAYLRLYEKSVPREEKEEETNEAEEEEQKAKKAYLRALYEKSVQPREEKEEETVTNETTAPTSISMAASDSSSVKYEEINNVSESSDIPKEEEEQEEVQPSASTLDPKTSRTKLQNLLMSKDTMYQNQIDALTEKSSNEIHELETNVKLTKQELADYQKNMTAQLTRTQLTASQKEHALFSEITTLLAQLEEAHQAVLVSGQQNDSLQQERADLQEELTFLQEQYSEEKHDLEDLYELEQTARATEQAEHVSVLLQTEVQSRGQVEAVEKAAIDQVEHLRVEYTRMLYEKEKEIESVHHQLSSVRQGLRDREDLIADWAGDRSSARALTRQLWQLLKGRFVARARRIMHRLQLWFSDEAPY